MTEINFLGRYARTHLRYLQQSRPMVVADMKLRGALNRYLHDIDAQAEGMFSLLMTQLAKRNGIDENLKANDQMAWIKGMQTIRSQAEEAVMADIIYS